VGHTGPGWVGLKHMAVAVPPPTLLRDACWLLEWLWPHICSTLTLSGSPLTLSASYHNWNCMPSYLHDTCHWVGVDGPTFVEVLDPLLSTYRIAAGTQQA
jgi:hypothetical protein